MRGFWTLLGLLAVPLFASDPSPNVRAIHGVTTQLEARGYEVTDKIVKDDGSVVVLATKNGDVRQIVLSADGRTLLSDQINDQSALFNFIYFVTGLAAEKGINTEASVVVESANISNRETGALASTNKSDNASSAASAKSSNSESASVAKSSKASVMAQSNPSSLSNAGGNSVVQTNSNSNAGGNSSSKANAHSNAGGNSSKSNRGKN